MYDLSRSIGKGMMDSYTDAQKDAVREYVSKNRWKDVDAGQYGYGPHEMTVSEDNQVIIPEGAPDLSQLPPFVKRFVDYYYVLQEARNNIDVCEIRKLLQRFGLFQMAGAVMYVEKELLGLRDDCLVVPVDVERGKFMLNEIILSGNFGHYDSRVGDFNRRTALGRNMERMRRDIRLMRLFPSECIWEPMFRLYHYLWRVVNS